MIERFTPTRYIECMCILFTAIKQHPTYPVIICANRDEFHQRPTQAMHQWPDSTFQQHTIAGKDLQAGGTWLGVNKNKGIDTHDITFSALTNYRKVTTNPPSQSFRSRGKLVTKALTETPENLIKHLASNAQQYQGFNLVFGHLNVAAPKLSCFDSVKGKIVPLNDGFHSICNGALDDIWPKMATGLKQLECYIKQDDISISALFNMMTNAEQAPEHLLPNTGVPIEWEQRLSSIFIISPEYGTRSTCILMLDNKGLLTITERSYNPQGQQVNQQAFSLNL